MIDLGDGTQALLPEEWLEQHGLLTTIAEAEPDHLRFRSSQAVLLHTLLTDNDQVQFDQPYLDMRDQLQQANRI